MALATQAKGYSIMNLQDFVARAVHYAVIRSGEDGVVNYLSHFFSLVTS